MTYSYTSTSTYTATDVKRVMDYFAADFDMIAQSTGLRTRENVKAVSADIRKMAVAGYLDEVNLYLVDKSGATIRATKYKVSDSAFLWSSDKPSKNLWPASPGGQLKVHVTHNRAWSVLTQAQRVAFESDYEVNWGTGNIDTSFPMLSQAQSQQYASNAYGLKKTLFT